MLQSPYTLGQTTAVASAARSHGAVGSVGLNQFPLLIMLTFIIAPIRVAVSTHPACIPINSMVPRK